MPMFLVFLLGLTVAVVRGIDLGDPSGIHFDVNSEYATSYGDYKPRGYQFEYGVSDPHTGDHKSHWEVKENGVVRGEYSLLEPDGTTRVVQYVADDHGFRAVVKKIGHAIHPSTSHINTDIHSSPIVVPEIHQSKISEPYFKTYDGRADNYIDLVDNSNLPLLLSRGPTNHHELPEISSTISLPQSHILGANTPSLSISEPTGISLDSYQPLPVPKAEDIIGHQPLVVHNSESIHIQEPINIHESANLESYGAFSLKEEPVPQEPINIHETANLKSIGAFSLKEEPVSLGIRIDHPHGTSSSSYIGSTGNLEDDSAYTGYAKGVPSISWGSVDPKFQDVSSRYGSPIPYQYLSKRSVNKNIK